MKNDLFAAIDLDGITIKMILTFFQVKSSHSCTASSKMLHLYTKKVLTLNLKHYETTFKNFYEQLRIVLQIV